MLHIESAAGREKAHSNPLEVFSATKKLKTVAPLNLSLSGHLIRALKALPGPNSFIQPYSVLLEYYWPTAPQLQQLLLLLLLLRL